MGVWVRQCDCRLSVTIVTQNGSPWLLSLPRIVFVGGELVWSLVCTCTVDVIKLFVKVQAFQGIDS